MLLSVVIPCYNEEEGILELHRRVSDVCKSCVSESYEIVLVNDGSKDQTWTIMETLAAQDAHLVAVSLSRNYGHQLALSAGLQVASGDRIFILDADLQDPPELLSKMMDRMDDGCEVVYGQRIEREGETLFKRATAFGFYRLLNRMVDIEIPRDTGDFRLMSRRAVEVLNSMPEQHRFIRGMVSWIGMRQEPIMYHRAARFAGETKYPLSKMIKFAIDAMTGFSIKPLKMASYLGVCLGIFSVFLMLYVFIQFYRGQTVHGWTSLAVIILLLGSVQLFVIGILGEYLGRLYMEAKGRPLFVIDKIIKN